MKMWNLRHAGLCQPTHDADQNFCSLLTLKWRHWLVLCFFFAPHRNRKTFLLSLSRKFSPTHSWAVLVSISVRRKGRNIILWMIFSLVLDVIRIFRLKYFAVSDKYEKKISRKIFIFASSFNFKFPRIFLKKKYLQFRWERKSKWAKDCRFSIEKDFHLVKLIMWIEVFDSKSIVMSGLGKALQI